MWMTNVKLAAVLAAPLGIAGAFPLMAHTQHSPVLQQKETSAPAGKTPAARAQRTKALPTAAALGPRVYVFGAVTRSGYYDYKPGDRTLDALMSAGLAPDADTSRVSIIHVSKDKKTSVMRKINVSNFVQKGDMAGNLLIVPGDTLFVAKKGTQSPALP